MIRRNLTDAEKKSYPKVAGIYVFWNPKESKGRGMVLGFDLERLRKEAGVEKEDYPWLARLKQNQWIMKNLDRARELVERIKEFEVTPELLSRLEMADLKLEEVLSR